MKKQILALVVGFMSVVTFAQKKELRAAEKALSKSDYKTAMASLESVKGMLADMEEKYKSQYYFLNAQVLSGKNDLQGAAEAFNQLFDYEKQTGKKRYSKEAEPMLMSVIQKVSQRAINLYNNDKDFKNAAKDFYLTYKLSPKDTSFLYNAAVSASLAKEYDTSLEYYKELQKLGYTGITSEYYATNKETGVVENLGTKDQRDFMIKSGQYMKPEDKSTESKQSDIIKNIGYIYIRQGKTQEAISAITEARKTNPKDLNLILNEAQLYIKLEKMDKFAQLMEEAIELDPNNPTLFFNLGVVNQNENKTEEAIGYYKKAIELKPDYGDAYMNLAVAILSGEKAIVDEMNKNLSNFKKYEELEEKQKALYRRALPYLEKADEIKRSEDTVKSLLNIYDILLMEEKADKLRPIYKKMRGQ